MIEIQPIAPDIAVAAQPSKDDIRRLAEQGYRTLINNRTAGETPGQLPPDVEEGEAERQGLAYFHIPISGSDISREDVEAFQRALEEGPKPVLAHCQSGKRSYLVWAAGEVLGGRREADQLVEEAGAKGYDLQALPAVVKRLRA